jgi:hypothetical protein
MASRYDIITKNQAEFREVFRNLYMKGFSIGAVLWTAGNLVFGLIFSA